jgi:ketosteroid isomerase-like protein
MAGCSPGQFLGPKMTPTPTVMPRASLSASDVKALAVAFDQVAGAQVEAWNSHDVAAIRKLYTDDIIHYDGSPKFVGIDAVMGMASMMFGSFPKFSGKLGDTYIGRQDGVDTWQMWNMLGFEESLPGMEFDLIQTRSGLISYWRLFYTRNLMEQVGGTVDKQSVESFGTAWSSGDPSAVAALYTQDAVREDTLFGEHFQGNAAIKTFAGNFFSWYPKSTWELLQAFGETSPGAIQGGVFALHVADAQGNPCAVKTLVLLEKSSKGISSEKDYYNADSLIACNWAR